MKAALSKCAFGKNVAPPDFDQVTPGVVKRDLHAKAAFERLLSFTVGFFGLQERPSAVCRIQPSWLGAHV